MEEFIRKRLYTTMVIKIVMNKVIKSTFIRARKLLRDKSDIVSGIKCTDMIGMELKKSV